VKRPAGRTWRLAVEALRRDPEDRWAAAFGRIAVYSFAVAVITGILLLPFFRPSMATVVYHGSYRVLDGVPMSRAYQSVLAASFDVRGGLLIRQVHHWSADIFVATVCLRLLRVFFRGRFSGRHLRGWLIWVALLLLGMQVRFPGRPRAWLRPRLPRQIIRRADAMDGSRSIVIALKRISAAGRQAWAPEPGADGAALVEYLYVPCSRLDGHPARTHRWVQQVPIVRKTAKRIYYTSDSWNRSEAVISPGCISREQFENAGVIPIPGDRHRSGPAGRMFFATREAAEAYLHCRERERPGWPARPAALIRQLRHAMADAHPDRGGTAEQVIEARRRYQTALRAGQAA
jgi:hypothetical protein